MLKVQGGQRGQGPASSDGSIPFRRIAIAGLGLIGGSIALAVRGRWPECRLVGVDRTSVLAHALGSAAVDRGASRLTEIGEVDLVILAAPVRQNVELLKELTERSHGGVSITDVGGTKRDIVQAAQALGASMFVGGHPIGGAERGGFGFARPDLFAGRPWVFTPDESSSPDTLGRLFQFVQGLGAKPTTMNAADHDTLMAFLSHLPQLTASALMDVVGRAATVEGLGLAGRGLIDTTRLASSPSSVWRDVCATNADAIGEALDRFIERLAELRADLRRGDTVDAIFDEAARWRAELMKGRE